jgi:hypothetical protein
VTQSVSGSIETISHQVNRLPIQIDDSFDGFRNRVERAVPVFQSERFDSLVDRGVDWTVVVEVTAENAPHDLIPYWSHDFTSLMCLAGDRGRCVEYLMGNHTVAQKMQGNSRAGIKRLRTCWVSFKLPLETSARACVPALVRVVGP